MTVTDTAATNAAAGPARTGLPTVRALTRWRDWNLPVKLAAVVLVPIIFAIVLGVLQVVDQVRLTASYRALDGQVAVSQSAHRLTLALQRERNATPGLPGGTDPAAELDAARRDVDGAIEAFRAAAGRASFTNSVTTTRLAEANREIAGIADLRLRADQAAEPAAAVTDLTSVVRTLLGFDRAAAEEVFDPALAGTAGALHDLEAAREEVAYQQALGSVGIGRRGIAPAELDALRASDARLADRIADFRAVGSPREQAAYDLTVNEPGLQDRQRQYRQLVSSVPVAGIPSRSSTFPVNAKAWAESSEVAAGRLGDVSGQLDTWLREGTSRLQDRAGNGAGLTAVVLLLALVLAAAIMMVVVRQLLGSLNLLQRSALDVANHTLPDAVARIRDDADGTPVEVAPVPVSTEDEIGQLARAFDAVHLQAIRLATEQASLRASYAGMFVNLSRRSQGLVQRQLQLLERLERDEEDADQLATLFQLDHLATRMRRNNENLMVLSGGDLARRSAGATGLGDLLRAAVSEVEQYRRISITPPPKATILGYAVGDLVRLIAELLDNATTFSAPETRVTIACNLNADATVSVEVLDHGIGMTEDEVAAANVRLAGSDAVDVSTARRMGLFVVGRLAARHGVQVRLFGGKDIVGLRASITVPAELVGAGAQPTRLVDPSATTMAMPTHPNARTTNGSASPRREKPATNGSGGTNGAEVTQQINRLLGDIETAPSKDRVPLPRRAPAGPPTSTPAPSPADTAIIPSPAPGWDSPKPPEPITDAGYESSPADALFVAQVSPAAAQDTGWWNPAGADHRADTGQDVHYGQLVLGPTPIFDEMVSAWFRVGGETEAVERDTAEDADWGSAADQGWQAALDVAEAEPATFTSSGLPRRSPRQNLLPGSVDGDGAAAMPAVGEQARDAVAVRGRLSSYRQGVHRARQDHDAGRHSRAELAAPTTEMPADSTLAWPSVQDLTDAGWSFDAGSGWGGGAGPTETAEPKPSEPSESSEPAGGGLPRRRPRANLMPGSVEVDPADDSPAEIQRDADALRGRLGSLQRGISRGRDNLADRVVGTACNQERESG